MATPNEQIDQAVAEPVITFAVDEVVDDPAAFEEEPDSPTGPTQDEMTLHSFGLDVRYEFDSGIAGAAKCGPAGTPAAVWRVHGGLCHMVVTFEAVSLGVWPKVPSPAEMVPNEHLLKHNLAYKGPQPNTTAFPAYKIAGEYVYLLRYAPAPGDPLAGTSSPYYGSSMPPSLNYVTIDSFDKNLLARLNPSRYSGTAEPTLQSEYAAQ